MFGSRYQSMCSLLSDISDIISMNVQAWSEDTGDDKAKATNEYSD